ncbi:MAG: ATP/GTP-binding protein [Anaerolineae bacterium]|nr:ATP/GTP-binding protein [Anaerolineae bacterium]
MFQSFHIKNFRCFRDLKLDGLARVNLIAGANNVGKTALLEALFLHLGPTNPALGDNLNLLRGMKREELGSAEDVWGPLFPNYDIDLVIGIDSRDDANLDRFLSVSLGEPKITRFTQPQNEGERLAAFLTTRLPNRQMVVKYHDSSGQEAVSRAYATDVISFEEIGKVTGVPPAVFLGPSTLRADVERFSDLQAVGREEEITSTLKWLEPRLKRLAVLVTQGVPQLHGDMGIGRLIPLSMMGGGMTRLLSIVLAIATTENGVVLIDEIENGLHYSVMKNIWATIGRASRASNTQIFVTTHSWECITAAHEAFSDILRGYDFRLYRLERADEDIQPVKYDQGMLDAAIKVGLEVR